MNCRKTGQNIKKKTGQGTCCFNDFPASFKTNFINANFQKNSPEELVFLNIKIKYNLIRIVCDLCQKARCLTTWFFDNKCIIC